MVDFRARIAARAHETIDGASYHRFRARAAAHHTFYEVPLPEGATWGHVAERVWPDLARWLAERRIDPEAPGELVVAVFLGSTCYLVRGDAFRDLFCEIEGLGHAAFHFRVQRWLTE